MTNNKQLFTAIFSKHRMRLLLSLSTDPTNAISIQALAKKTKIPQANVYRFINTISKWDNIGKIDKKTTKDSTNQIGHPIALYYIKKTHFTLNIDKKYTIKIVMEKK